MKEFYCPYLNSDVELTSERELHIQTYHPDMKQYLDKIREVLLLPDEIRESIYDEEVIIFYKFYLKVKGGKYISVVMKIDGRNFILTSYLTDKIKGGELLWRKD